MKKKILSLGLVLVMSMSASMMAFAADTVIENPNASGVYGGTDVNITGDTKVPVINITVPSDGAVGVNPYQLKHNVGDLTNATDSLISPEYTIKNESNVAIRVDVAVTGTPAGETVFSAAALKGTELTKSVFMYFDIKEKAGAYTDFNLKSTSQVVVGTKTIAKKGVITLGEGATTATEANYKFFGGVATNPTSAWTAADKVDVKLVFTFAPVLPVLPVTP